MMSGYHKLKTACCVAVLTLGLAACGGGNQTQTAETAAPDPTPPPTAAEQLMMAESAVAAAQAAVAAAMTPAEISAAYGQLASAQMLLSTAQSIPANQIAILTAQLEQLRIDLQDTEMLAEQRGTVGAALITAQNAVNGLSASSSDADAMAAAALVAAADAALAGASALPEDDSLHGSVAAVVAQLAGVEMSRTVYSQRGMVDAALAAAGELVGGLTNTSTDDEVAAAYAAVMAAQTALAEATALPADDSRHASVTGVEEALGDARTMRTAYMDTQTINGLISEAQTAVGGLDQVTSSGMAVTEARAAVEAAMAAIAASTALTEAEKAALSAQISADYASLTSIETYRGTASGQLAVANSAIERARALVAGLSSTSTPEEAAAAYGALAEASLALHTATNLPDNVIAKLQDDLKSVQDTLSDTQSATAAVVAATTAVAGLDNDSPAADVTDARAAVEAAKTALASAVNVSASDRASLQAAIDSLGTSLSTVEMAVAERPTPEQIAAAEQKTKDAATKVTAINAEAMQTTEVGLGGNDGLGNDGMVGGDDDTHSLAIERPRAGTKITIADSTMTGEDDPKFEQVMDLGESNRFARTMHLRVNSDTSDEEDGSKVEEVVIVATDIAAPTATPFNDVHALDVNTNMENDPDTGDPTNEALMVVAGDDNGNFPLIKSPSFTAGTAAVLTFAFEQEAADPPVAAFEGDGTYDGADGTYKCNGDGACTVTLDAEGMITAVAGEWIFTPDTGETVDVADSQHLSYGFWLQRTTKDGATTYDEVETFTMATGIARSGNANLTGVEGSATYNGGATGVYVKNVLDDQGEITSATAGQFSATAKLTATFGGGDVAANSQFAIGGKITGFALEHGEENDWAVSLDLADFSGRANDDPGESVPGSTMSDAFSATATGDSTAAAGSWNGAFYGSTADFDHDMDLTTPLINPQPAAVLGEFNANFTDGTTAGAFGAKK